MIVHMARVRVLGPRPLLGATLEALQDLGLLHLERPTTTGCSPVARTPSEEREAAELTPLVADLEAALRLMEPYRETGRMKPVRPEELAGWATRAREIVLMLEALADEARRLEEERALIVRSRTVLRGFEPLLAHAAQNPAARVYHLMLRSADHRVLGELRIALEGAIGPAYELATHAIGRSETACALIVPVTSVEAVERILAQVPLETVPVPTAYTDAAGGADLARMNAHLAEIPHELERVAARKKELVAKHRAEVAAALAAAHDRLRELDAVAEVAETRTAFVIEGWIPADALDRLIDHLARAVGPTVVVERVAIEEWAGKDVPVVLHNPRLFRPFEAITRMLPLPRYGSLDPTPFVAVGFPMLFGIVLGDIGYAAMLALLALVLRWRSRPGSKVRDVSMMALACAAFAAVFGVIYGELFGDLGHRAFGLEALVFAREEAIIPSLVFALGLGLIHIVLGLVLGVITSLRGHEPRKKARRHALGRGIAAVMLVLIAACTLAVLDVLPSALFTPLMVTTVAVFPLLVVAEGVLAPVELVSTIGHVLSYARIMAVGTASVMMAVVANRMVGAVGSVLVGALFALLFHVINFAIGVVSPTIHVLRLHFVEFMGTFHSPGGTAYRPLSRWRDEQPHSAAR